MHCTHVFLSGKILCYNANFIGYIHFLFLNLCSLSCSQWLEMYVSMLTWIKWYRRTGGETDQICLCNWLKIVFILLSTESPLWYISELKKTPFVSHSYSVTFLSRAGSWWSQSPVRLGTRQEILWDERLVHCKKGWSISCNFSHVILFVCLNEYYVYHPISTNIGYFTQLWTRHY